VSKPAVKYRLLAIYPTRDRPNGRFRRPVDLTTWKKTLASLAKACPLTSGPAGTRKMRRDRSRDA
jgi:hypothetical protein